MIDDRKFFDQPINSMIKAYKNIRLIATGQEDDYTTDCLLDDSYFKENYKLTRYQMQIQEQFNKLILQQIQIELEIQQYFSIIERVK